MATSADRSSVLTELPTEPGSVIARSYQAFGETLFDAAVLLPDAAAQFTDGEMAPWSHTGRYSNSSVVDQAKSITFDDWVSIGRFTFTFDQGEVLTELPTEPGSVIARVHRTQGVRIAVLNALADYEDTDGDRNYWARSGLDAWPALKQSAKWLKKHRWVLLGVIPPGDSRRTKEQEQAVKAIIPWMQASRS